MACWLQQKWPRMLPGRVDEGIGRSLQCSRELAAPAAIVDVAQWLQRRARKHQDSSSTSSDASGSNGPTDQAAGACIRMWSASKQMFGVRKLAIEIAVSSAGLLDSVARQTFDCSFAALQVSVTIPPHCAYAPRADPRHFGVICMWAAPFKVLPAQQVRHCSLLTPAAERCGRHALPGGSHSRTPLTAAAALPDTCRAFQTFRSAQEYGKPGACLWVQSTICNCDRLSALVVSVGSVVSSGQWAARQGIQAHQRLGYRHHMRM